MRKLFFILFAVTFIFASLAAAGNRVTLNNSDMPFDVNVVESDGNRTVLNYRVNSYYIDEISIDGSSYTLFEKMRKESIIEEAGKPRLPRINRSIIIPDNGIMSYRVVASNYIEINDIDVAPSKGNILRTVDPATVPYTFGEEYQKDAFFPESIVNIRDPYIVRDYRGAVVELNAFQYNPVTRTLRIYTDVTIEVYKSAPGGENTISRASVPVKVNRQFLEFYEQHFVNFSELDYPHLPEDGSMLIICYDPWMDILEPLAEWKTQKGIPCTLVPISEVGTSSNAIRNYIRDLYLSSDLAYVLLVGDAAQIPTMSGDSDPVYALISGGDSYPELFIGRFSAESAAHAQTQVDRTINYEMSPQMGADWYHKGLGVASNQGPGHHGELDREHITLIAYKLLNYTYTQVDSAYDPWGTDQMVTNALNDGRSTINYCGHGSTTSWGSTGFNNADVNNLENAGMLPFITSVACVNGNFTGSTCFAEAWLRARDIAGNPTGAMATYMSVQNQSWNPPMDMEDEGVDLMIRDSLYTFGGLCFNGSMLMIDLNGGTGEDEFKAWTIFGDPSLRVRNDSPYQLTVSSNPVLLIGTTTYNVTVNGPSGPLEGVMVCAKNDEIYDFSATNALGQVTLNIAPILPDEFTLTVTGWNAVPYITTIDIIPPNGPYVVYNDHVIQDDLTGNNNGQLDYAETVQLGIYAENVGVNLAENTTGTITTVDPLVTIIDGSADFGDITAGATSFIDRAFEIELASEVEDGYIIDFDLEVTDGANVWPSNFTVTAHAPIVEFASLTVDDITGGNGNGNLDPGETADINVTLTNIGSCDVDDIEVVFSSIDPYVTLNTTTGVYGTIAVGGTAEASFNVTVSNSCPQEYELEFSIDVDGALGYSGSAGFTAIVGDLQFAPTGPDNYGYMAYDINDAPFFPAFDWMELSADSGGPGTAIPFVDDDQVLHYALPFTFQYYSQTTDSITVSSNGWVSTIVMNQIDYSNSSIPNSDGPPSMIAPFWEDMSPQSPTSGGVWHYYDQANNRFIIEFNHVEQYAPVGAFETFQVIFLDPAHYETSTGDGQIIFQYKDMSVTSQEEGTIGIENSTETDGIQYLYDGAYDIHATPTNMPMAILFTTPIDAPEMSVTMEPASEPVIIPAGGGTFEYTIMLENIGQNPVVYDAWIDVILPNQTLFGPLILRTGLSLGTGGSLIRVLDQYVPGAAPSGTYTYNGKAGNYSASLLYDIDNFEFEKIGVDGSSRFDNWQLEGWDGSNSGTTALIPDEYFLDQNFPNPFNPETNITFGLPENGNVTLKVYNVLGEVVATLMDGQLPAGLYEFKWSAGTVSSGIYFYRLDAPGFTGVKKMMLVR